MRSLTIHDQAFLRGRLLDFARQGTATSSAVYQGNVPVYGPQNLNDGSVSTLAIAPNTPQPAWQKLDLGSSMLVKTIVIKAQNSTHPLIVESSNDNSTWTRRVGLVWVAGDSTIVLPTAVSARYWRLLGDDQFRQHDHATAGGVEVGSLELYDSGTYTVSGMDVAMYSNPSTTGYYQVYNEYRAIDGNSSTECIVIGASPNIIAFDNAAIFPVASYLIRETQFAGNMVLESSPDNSTWTSRATAVGQAANTGSFSPVSARYWRVRATSSQTMNLTQVRLFDS